MKAESTTIMLELTQEIRKLREAIAPLGVPAMMRTQEYYKIAAKKRIDVYTEKGKTEPYTIPYTRNPKILLLIPWGDDVQVEFDAEVAEDSVPVRNGSGLSLATEGVRKIYAQSLNTDLTAPPNGLYILLLG